MSTDILEQWPEWRDTLIFELRMKDVPGGAIGDIVSEIAAHVAETGESPQEAFGDPLAYGRRRAETATVPPPAYLGLGVSDTVRVIASFFGGLMAAGSAWALGAGDARWGPFPTWLALILGLALLFGPLILIKPDLVTDPRTGKPMFNDRKTLYRLSTGFGLVALVLMGVAGWYFAK